MPTTCLVSGNLQALTSGAIRQGSIVFQLTNTGSGNPIGISGTSIIPNLSYTAQSAGDGSFSVNLWGNDNINPANTLYSVMFRDSLGNEMGPILYSITGSTANLNSLTASSTVPPIFIPTLTPSAIMQSFNTVLYVGGGIPWTGSDIGAQINSAYAALPANGGIIFVLSGSYSFSTPIVFGTANKPAILAGTGYSVQLSFTGTSGTAVTFNCGPGAITNHPRGYGLRDLELIGPATGTTAGLLLGGTNGAEGFLAHSIQITNFNVDVQYGNNTWATCFVNCIIRNGAANLLLIGTATNSGEEICFVSTTFIQDTGSTGAGPFAAAVSINNSNFDVNFMSCSFDNAQIALSTGFIGFNNLHMEMLNAQSAPYISVTTGAMYGSGLDLLNDSGSTTAASAISVAGGSSTFTVNGIRVGSNGYTFPALFALSGGAQLCVTGNLGGLFTVPVSVSTFTGSYVVHGLAQPTDPFIIGGGGSGTTIQVKNENGGQSWAIDSLNTGDLSIFPKTNTANFMDIGAAGVKLSALVSSVSNAAAGGLVRLASTDVINWRNNANSADVTLSKNASDNLLWTNNIQSNGTIVTGTAPTVSAGQVGFGASVSTSATAGTNGAVPAQVAGYIIIDVAGTAMKVPYFNV